MGQELDFTVKFDPAFKDDLFSRVAEGEVVITYREHPHYDSLKLKGEVSDTTALKPCLYYDLFSKYVCLN